MARSKLSNRLAEVQHGAVYPVVPSGAEVAVGMPAPAEPVVDRKGGRIASAEAARILGRRGGQEAARRRADAKGYAIKFGLGRMLDDSPTEEALRPFVAEGEQWVRVEVERLAADVGGGVCSPAVVSIIRGAGWSRLFATYLADLATRRTGAKGPRTDLMLTAQRLFDSSRQALLAATHLAAVEAESRSKSPNGPRLGWRVVEDK